MPDAFFVDFGGRYDHFGVGQRYDNALFATLNARRTKIREIYVGLNRHVDGDSDLSIADGKRQADGNGKDLALQTPCISVSDQLMDLVLCRIQARTAHNLVDDCSRRIYLHLIVILVCSS